MRSLSSAKRARIGKSEECCGEDRGCGNAATFRAVPGFPRVKTFLKVLLLVIVALIAIKLLPLTIGLGFVLGLLLVGLAAVGVSLVAGVSVVALALAAVLAPIWVPILLLVGLIALIRRATRRSAA